MPLTSFQMELGRLLAKNRTEDSYLAGGAAILIHPNTLRYSTERVASAFETDRKRLLSKGHVIQIEVSQPGYIRAIITKTTKTKDSTKIEWAQDSCWRFMPVIKNEMFGYQLHPVDLATN